jgi:hypothetical protein
VKFVAIVEGGKVVLSDRRYVDDCEEGKSHEEDGKVNHRCEELLTMVDCRGVDYKEEEEEEEESKVENKE